MGKCHHHCKKHCSKQKLFHFVASACRVSGTARLDTHCARYIVTKILKKRSICLEEFLTFEDTFLQ
jgi:hypothetical protein